MEAFLVIVGAVGAVLILVLAALGVLALVAFMMSPTGERRRIEEQAREAERQVAVIGRRAQAAILTEFVRRAQERTDRDSDQ